MLPRSGRWEKDWAQRRRVEAACSCRDLVDDAQVQWAVGLSGPALGIEYGGKCLNAAEIWRCRPGSMGIWAQVWAEWFEWKQELVQGCRDFGRCRPGSCGYLGYQVWARVIWVEARAWWRLLRSFCIPLMLMYASIRFGFWFMALIDVSRAPSKSPLFHFRYPFLSRYTLFVGAIIIALADSSSAFPKSLSASKPE